MKRQKALPRESSTCTMLRREVDDNEMFKIMDGMEEVNRKMEKDISAMAPMCHMRKMFMDQSDSTDGFFETWWECSVCGHTKEYK
jgi:hypothetical protein